MTPSCIIDLNGRGSVMNAPVLRGICEELGFRSFRDTAAGFTATRPE